MRISPKEQRLASLEGEFRPLLVKCLVECAAGRWGLFGQHEYALTPYRAWPEAEELLRLATAIRALRAEFGQPGPLCERFFAYRMMHGSNVKGEPKLAAQFLAEIDGI